MNVRFAIIGGTGVYTPGILEDPRDIKIETPYGEAKAIVGKCLDKEVAFMARHGEEHNVPPHLVNYKANIWGLKELGVKNIFATAAVGSLAPDMKPGQMVFVDQFIDFTKNRPHTFINEGGIHTDMTNPYCPRLRKILCVMAAELGLEHHTTGTYVCTEGPRFETPAEIRMFRHLGGDLVGMTGVPEVVLAREAGICYATIAPVTNFAAGVSAGRLSHQEVVNAMDENIDKIRYVLLKAIEALEAEENCRCRQP